MKKYKKYNSTGNLKVIKNQDDRYAFNINQAEEEYILSLKKAINDVCDDNEKIIIYFIYI